MRTFELWKSVAYDGNLVLLDRSDPLYPAQIEGLMEQGELLTSFEATDWITALQVRNDFLGLGKYDPMINPTRTGE